MNKPTPHGRHSPHRRQRLLERIRRFKDGGDNHRSDRPTPRAVVPSFFTLMNLFCGFLAVIQVNAGEFVYAGWLIVLAGFFDMMDGMMARLTDTSSPFGVELDSLSDVVSFGLAPSFMVYSFGLERLNALGLIAAGLPVICGAVRLARYNVMYEAEKKGYFDGLPIPVQAITLVAFIMTFNDPTWLDQFRWGNLSILMPLVLLLSMLMISTIEFQAIPKPTREFFQNHPRTAVAYAVGGVLILLFQETGLFITLVGYIFINLSMAIYATIWE